MSTLTALYIRIRNNRFAQDSFWALLGNVAAKGMSLLGSILVARFLGKEVFGEFGTIKSTLMNLAIFSTFGLGYTATKFIAEYKKSNPERLHEVISFILRLTTIISCFIALILFLFAQEISTKFLNGAHFTIPLRLLSVWLVLNALTSSQIGILSGFAAFKALARINTIVGIFSFVLSVLLTYFWQLNGALLALLVIQIINWFLNYREVKKHFNYQKYKTLTSINREIFWFSFPVALQEATYAFSSWTMIILLINLGNHGQVGLYTAALQWSMVVLFIPGILRNVILSHFSEISNCSDNFNEILKRTLLLNLLATLTPFLLIVFAGSWVTNFYGESYTGLSNLINVTVGSSVIMSLNGVFGQAYLSLGKNWFLFSIRFLADLMALLLTWTMIIKLGFDAAISLAYSILIAQIFLLIIKSSNYYIRMINIQTDLNNV